MYFTCHSQFLQLLLFMAWLNWRLLHLLYSEYGCITTSSTFSALRTKHDGEIGIFLQLLLMEGTPQQETRSVGLKPNRLKFSLYWWCQTFASCLCFLSRNRIFLTLVLGIWYWCILFWRCRGCCNEGFFESLRFWTWLKCLVQMDTNRPYLLLFYSILSYSEGHFVQRFTQDLFKNIF